MEESENVEGPISESEDGEEFTFSKTEMDTDPAPSPANRTLKHKIIYYSDRVFLCFLLLVMVVLSLEIAYKIWYFIKWKTIYNYLGQLARWLIAQEEQEEISEL